VVRCTPGEAGAHARIPEAEDHNLDLVAWPVRREASTNKSPRFADTPIEVRVEHVGTPRPYASFVEAQGFRITSEALTNAGKHSDCRSVVVTCTHRRRELRLVVRDDGRGFATSCGAAPGGHRGLLGMRERAATIDVALTIESAPGRGTTVTLVVPRAARHETSLPHRAAACRRRPCCPARVTPWPVEPHTDASGLPRSRYRLAFLSGEHTTAPSGDARERRSWHPPSVAVGRAGSLTTGEALQSVRHPGSSREVRHVVH
jgi:hypothetical protein